jgi:hypothetical protein
VKSTEKTLTVAQVIEARNRGLRNLADSLKKRKPMTNLEAVIKAETGHEHFNTIMVDKFPHLECVVNKNVESGKSDTGGVELKTTTTKKKVFWLTRGQLIGRSYFVFLQCDEQIATLDPIQWRDLIKHTRVRTGGIKSWASVGDITKLMNKIDKTPKPNKQKHRFENKTEDSYCIPLDALRTPSGKMFEILKDQVHDFGYPKDNFDELEKLQLSYAYDSLCFTCDV